MSACCRHLRWKSRDPEMTDPEQRAVFFRNHLPYSCLLTAQPWGRDGEIAAPETCHAGRKCFETSGSARAEDGHGSDQDGG